MSMTLLPFPEEIYPVEETEAVTHMEDLVVAWAAKRFPGLVVGDIRVHVELNNPRGEPKT